MPPTKFTEWQLIMLTSSDPLNLKNKLAHSKLHGNIKCPSIASKVEKNSLVVRLSQIIYFKDKFPDI